VLAGLYIFVDDDFADPIHADPPLDELDDEVREAICTVIFEAVEGDGKGDGTSAVSDVKFAWRLMAKAGLSFVVVVEEDLSQRDAMQHLQDVQKRYLDEVDDLRNPDKAGVQDVIVDVIPHWEE
jgi:hypothetical protein